MSQRKQSRSKRKGSPAANKAGPAATEKSGSWKPRLGLGAGLLLILVAVLVWMRTSGGDPARPFAPEDLRGEGWNVLLISLDTTRPDHLAAMGGNGVATPGLSRVAGGGVVFSQMSTPTPITLPSHATLLTGLDPYRHGVRENTEYALAESWTTLAEHLAKNGYRTGAVVSTFVLDERFGLAQGFDDYQDRLDGPEQALRLGSVELPGSIVAARAGRWIADHATQRRNGAESRPFFLFAHFFDAHAPYRAPSPYDRVSAFAGGGEGTAFNAPYLGELAYQDASLGQLLDQLETSGESDRTLIWVVSDHGESLGEHGEETHSLFVYDATQRAVSVLRLPDDQPLLASSPRWSLSDNVGIVDVVPTLVELLELEPMPDGTDGRSLVPRLGGGVGDPERAIYMETWSPYISYHWSPLAAVRTKDWKYIRAPYPELYDLQNDTGEQENLAAAHPAKASELDARLDQFLNQSSKDAATRAPSEEELEQFRSLGYLGRSGEENGVGGSIESFDWAKETLPDPKRQTKFFRERLQRAKSLLHAGRLPEAISAFQSAIEADPRNNAAHLYLAGAQRQAGNLADAEQSYRRVIEIQPRSSRAWYGLGRTAVAQESWSVAAQAFRRHTELLPQSPDGWEGLADVEAAHLRYETAIAYLDSAETRGILPVFLHGRLARIYRDHLPDPKKAEFHLREYGRLLGTDSSGAAEQLPTVP